MCGRKACTLPPQTIKDNLNTKKWVKQDLYRPSYNVAPTRYQPVLIYDSDRVLMSMKWGNMGDNPQMTTINARSEGITQTALWSKLLPTHRCAVVADGYFEWKEEGNKKKPHFIRLKDKPLVVMAGLYEEKLGEDGETVYHYSVITTRSANDIGWLHDRMPVILDTDEKIDLWIAGDWYENKDKILALLQPYEGLDCYAVPEMVNSNRNDTPDCIRPLADFKKNGGIAAFFKPKKEAKDVDTKVKQEETSKSKDAVVKTEDTKDNKTEDVAKDTEQKDDKVKEEPKDDAEQKKQGSKRKLDKVKEEAESEDPPRKTKTSKTQK